MWIIIMYEFSGWSYRLWWYISGILGYKLNKYSIYLQKHAHGPNKTIYKTQQLLEGYLCCLFFFGCTQQAKRQSQIIIKS